MGRRIAFEHLQCHYFSTVTCFHIGLWCLRYRLSRIFVQSDSSSFFQLLHWTRERIVFQFLLTVGGISPIRKWPIDYHDLRIERRIFGMLIIGEFPFIGRDSWSFLFLMISLCHYQQFLKNPNCSVDPNNDNIAYCAILNPFFRDDPCCNICGNIYLWLCPPHAGSMKLILKWISTDMFVT